MRYIVLIGLCAATLIAYVHRNSIGVAGMAWASTILPVKVLDNSGSGTDATVAQGSRGPRTTARA